METAMTTQVGPPHALRPAPEALTVRRQPPAPEVSIRPIRPIDAGDLERFYESLSVESRWARFFGGTAGLSHEQSSSFCTPDHHHREGFVAEFPPVSGSPGRIVGHLCLEPDGNRTAEFAIAVADAFHRRGIGRRLMKAGFAWAAREGVAAVTGTMLESNAEIRGLVAGMGLPVSFRALGSNVLAVTVDLRGAT